MHWLGYNDAVSLLNEVKTRIFPTANFENFEIRQPACRKKVMAADLRKCCSKDDLPTAPWRFLLSFFLLPCSLFL